MLQNRINKLKNWANAFLRFLAMSICLYPLSILAKGILGFCFNKILQYSGLWVLNQENFFKLYRHPFAILFLFVFFLFVCIIIFIEFTLLLYAVKDELHWGQLRRFVYQRIIKKARQLFSIEIGFFLVYLILMIPLANLGLSSTLLSKFKIPDFIGDELMKSTFSMLCYMSFQAVVFYLNIRLIYFLPYFSLTNKGLKESFISSLRATKHKFLAITYKIIKFIILTMLLTFSVTLIAAFIISILDPAKSSLLKASIIYTILEANYYAINLLVKFGLIYFMAQKIVEDFACSFPSLQKRPFYFNIHWWIFIIGFSIVAFLNQSQLSVLKENRQVLKISHRGDSNNFVENSLPALKAAKKEKADFVEMDVVMTKDKHFVVFHDKSLRRLANRKEKISQMTLKELKTIKIFNENNESTYIADLKEYLALSKQIKQPLFIELKLYHNDRQEYYQNFMKEYLSSDHLSDNRIISLDLDLLKLVKKDHPEIKTGYIIPIQWGLLQDLPVDFYVVEEFSYNTLFALSASKQGKEVYVWTINKKSEMERLMYSGVDGILTDDVKTLDKIVNSVVKESYYDLIFRLIAMREER